MVNVFVIHSGADFGRAAALRSELEQMNACANTLILENGGLFWKVDARKKIKKSQIVLFVVGKNSHKSKNIDWELSQAIRYNKSIRYVLLDEGNRLNGVLMRNDRFSNRTVCIAKKIDSVTEISDAITRYENGEYDVLNRSFDTMEKKELFEQYKIYLQTSESLVSRRQTVNSFYISVNAAMLSIAGAVSAVCSDKSAKIMVVCVIALVGIILDISWIYILEAYGTLNASKMKVLSIIEKQLPARLYDAEWEVMSDKMSNRRYVSFTDSEKRIPYLFGIVYLLIVIATVLYLALAG